MDLEEAKVYAIKRGKELKEEGVDKGTAVRLILRELRKDFNFATLIYSPSHGGHVPVKDVYFDDIITYDIG